MQVLLRSSILLPTACIDCFECLLNVQAQLLSITIVILNNCACTFNKHSKQSMHAVGSNIDDRSNTCMQNDLYTIRHNMLNYMSNKEYCHFTLFFKDLHSLLKLTKTCK